MKSKFIILTIAILSIGCVALTGCGSDNSTSSTATVSSEPETISSDVSSNIANGEESAISTNENLGEIVNGIFTSTNGIYQVTVPEGVNLLTAADTTTVFTTDEGKTTITISSEVNNGPFQNLKQESFEAVYSQLYEEFAVTNFEEKSINDKQTNYKLSFTGKDKNTPLQIHVCKAITNQRAITIQVSAEQNNDHATTILDTMAATLVFNK